MSHPGRSELGTWSRPGPPLSAALMLWHLSFAEFPPGLLRQQRLSLNQGLCPSGGSLSSFLILKSSPEIIIIMAQRRE